ncbi:MAG TPA: hypothetical protein DHV36_13400 [Desulfobacteraceae bacterium]|nr:hypothetical protein [Desulfobacteraceae bacterium]
MILYQTDQAQCWDAEGSLIPCSGSGQDGALNTGKAWPEPRFEVSSDFLTDRISGLVWPRDAALSEFPLSWEEAIDFAREMDKDRKFGLSGWRLPTRAEFFSLVSHARVNPALVNPDLFSNIFNGYYWTGTPCARHGNQAWYIHLAGGRVLRGMMHASCMVWPVCASPEPNAIIEDRGDLGDLGVSPDRFSHRGDLITDRETGLTWPKQGNPAGRVLNWPDALDLVREMNRDGFLGRQDWRMPNIRELECLVDEQAHSPALHPMAGFEDTKDFYWSSTTSVYDPSYAWTLYTRDGYIGVGYKQDPEFFLLPVCTGV